ARRGTSRSSQLNANASTAAPAAARNSGCIDSVTASMYACRTAEGRCLTSSGLAVVGGLTPGGSLPARCLASWFAKIAPKIETPTDPPICRNIVDDDVATPRYSYGTAFWEIGRAHV